MNIMQILEVLQRQVVSQFNCPIDLYYMEGYGALAVVSGHTLTLFNVIFAFPDIAIVNWR